MSLNNKSSCTIYKDETPEGDENNVSPLRIDTHTYIYKDETPEGDENYSRIVLARSLKIYKDETPEGDENYQIAPFSTLNSKHL